MGINNIQCLWNIQRYLFPYKAGTVSAVTGDPSGSALKKARKYKLKSAVHSDVREEHGDGKPSTDRGSRLEFWTPGTDRRPSLGTPLRRVKG